MALYHIEFYEDALEPTPDHVTETRCALTALHATLIEARDLHREDDDFRLGPAGDDEVLEVYPARGVGTVVLKVVEQDDD